MEALQMTDKQFDKIIKMIRMVLDGCKDLEEAKQKDYKVIEKATIYDLRRLFKNSDKATYTKEELCDLLDTIADAKDQE